MKTPSTELAVRSQDEQVQAFERIMAELNAGFDQARADIETQFDMIEQAGEQELARIKAETPQDDLVLQASVDFAKGQDELADTVDDLGRAAWEVQMLASVASARLAAVGSLMQ